MRKILYALLLTGTCLGAESSVQKAAALSGAPGATTTREKLTRTLKLVNVDNYIHENEKPGSSDEGPKGVGGTHPYEWDSLRSSEKILADRDGGSCGSHALAIASILEASGVESGDIRLLGTVIAQDYAQICPGAAGAQRSAETHSANGHVFLQVKIDGRWFLLNSTCNPLHLGETPETPTKAWLRARIAVCQPMPKSPARKKCFVDARAEAIKKVRLEDYELIPYSLVEPADLAAGSKPRVLPIEKFPSLRYLNPDQGAPLGPPLVPFATWTLQNYPRHTIEQRNNLVASGEVSNRTCRWSAAAVKAETETKPKSHKPPAAAPRKTH